MVPFLGHRRRRRRRGSHVSPPPSRKVPSDDGLLVPSFPGKGEDGGAGFVGEREEEMGG